MSKPKDGGPAFPRSASQHSGSNNGMSLHDYFAGQIAAGLAAADDADYCCARADAMLAKREKERE